MPEKEILRLMELRKVLAGPWKTAPYVFVFPDGGRISAENNGLEGFFFTLSEMMHNQSAHLLNSQVPYMVQYLSYLARRSCCNKLWTCVRNLQSAPPQSTSELLERILPTVESLRSELSQLDRASWLRHASMYQIFLRAFNLPGLRRVKNKDSVTNTNNPLLDLEPDELVGPFDAIRWTGVYPIGEVDVKGTGGGSPFSIRDHARIDSKWGSEGNVSAKLQKLSKSGTRNVFELLPNHTSVDSVLLKQNPKLFIHTTSMPADQSHWFKYEHQQHTFWIRRGGYDYDGVRYYWDDTLQLDISNPETVQTLVESLLTLVRKYKVDAFRVDMAYQLLNDKFHRLWNSETGYPLGYDVKDEFLHKLIWGVKSQAPHVGFIAEGFDSLDRLSECGFDLVYSKNEMTLDGGIKHEGWYNALESRDAKRISTAISRASFLHWQQAGSAMMAFVGHHDLPSPLSHFHEWVWGATFLTLHLPTAWVWYNGTEARYEAHCKENGKMITFNEAVEIDWSGMGDSWTDFVRMCLEQRSSYVAQALSLQIRLAITTTPGVVGYFLEGQDAEYLIMANMSPNEVSGSTTKLHSSKTVDFKMGACGPQGVLFAQV